MLSGLESPTHILILLLVVSLLFGTKRLPELGRSLGAGMREFKDAITGNEAATTDASTPAISAPPERSGRLS